MSSFCRKNLWSVLLALTLAGCGMGDDLLPSDRDLRGREATGALPGDLLAATVLDAPLEDPAGTVTRLGAILTDPLDPPEAVVIYFTMWCPVCLAHTDHLYNDLLPRYAGRAVRFLMVDYVSGSAADLRAVAQANGYLGAVGLVLVRDVQGTLFSQLNGAMGNVVVVDAEGTILLNAYYHDGRDVETVLDGLLGP